jgi:phosphoribosylglycinamide formyltransferase-1
MDAILKNCRTGVLRDCCTPELVLSNKAEAGGLKIAGEAGVPVRVIASAGKSREEFEKEVTAEVEKFQVDFIVLAGFNRILSPFFIRKFENRIINIHPADTKAFQGLHGYEWAFNNGLKKTKITVHYVDEGVDTGKIILQREVDLTGAETLDMVEQRGLEVENTFYSEALASLFHLIIEKNL